MQVLQRYQQANEHIATRPIPAKVSIDAFEDNAIEDITRIYYQTSDEESDGEYCEGSVHQGVLHPSVANGFRGVVEHFGSL
mmetsp:Transcript_25754/g.35382  ORF Transcript_25754/g.35382 Transcript_25754/m.35382 type:complete len:81 (-) Transcript_25754:281-523(-)